MSERAGKIEIVDETNYIEWRVSRIFEKEYFLYESPIFFAVGHSWKLLLGQSSDGTLSIAIWAKMKREHSLRYRLGLKKRDGNVENRVAEIFEDDRRCCLWRSFIMKEELLRRKTELAPSNVLTITCSLKRTAEISHPAESTMLEKVKSSKLLGLLSSFSLDFNLFPVHVTKIVGKVKTVDETKHIEWRISDIFGKEYFLLDSPLIFTADHTWTLFLRQNSDGTIAIAIHTCVKRKYSLRYSFGLKKCDGNTENLVSGFLEGDKRCSLWSYFIKKEELHRRKTELVPSDVLTVTCTLKRMTGNSRSTMATVLNKTMPLKLTSNL